jgi:creatinine amidohydrolase/Fe(II)-dependent formamide hydrolase-like protein|nr:creatininase family protein [Candidatus Krumholzibacteria bacterium]
MAPASLKDPLLPLLVWDRLEIGPPRIEAKRIRAAYTVVRDGQTESIDLTYSWEEEVFDPALPQDVNLAGMILAQLALNYGLFCREMVFHGPFDERDRRFLTDMARNTAREIYVNKFLMPNPFLVGEAAKLPAERRDDYLRAKLVFPDAVGEVDVPAWGQGHSDCCVLSSGGKDSLLSYGLLNEVGVKCHSVFINESGRHWFTALNAYRAFKEDVPGTARVWTDCDRVFNWMLRQLPFVRPDYAKVRADIYPVRLWTVAVFLFGALPLMKKRGISRLVIGDEFDTSIRARFKGITHYAGLYDQSRWFDQALSRYFHRKGWKVHQFSVLRHLSELLIEKILVERYPDLQALQVSCHAAHRGQENEKVGPCGRCEKCRRIVGMLSALGADPGRCGYTPEQIQWCLKEVLARDVKQESEGVDQMALLLHERGLWDSEKALPAPHPEVLQLRLDKEHAPLTTMPTDLRGPVLDLCGQHAQGAVTRSGRMWVPCDPRQESDFNLSAMHQTVMPPAEDKLDLNGKESWLLAHLTWPEAEARFRETDLVLLPVGAIEQHGPHLPLDTDAYDADHLARQVAAACSDPKPLVLPLIAYGVSYHHEDFPGTLSVTNETMAKIVYDVGMGVARCGATKLVIINGHGGNGPALAFAAQMINRDARIFTCVESGETSDVDIDGLAETPNDVHAGEVETSTTLALRPHLVRMDKARSAVPSFSSRFLDFTNQRSVDWNAYTHRISPTGVLGDPTKATPEKGKLMWDLIVNNLVEFVEDLKSLSLDEIHQRRY